MEVYNKGVDMSLLGKRIKSMRRVKDISTETLSAMVDKSGGSYIRMIESAQNGISLSALVDICNALSVSPEYLLADSLIFENELMSKINSLPTEKYNIVVGMVNTMVADNIEE